MVPRLQPALHPRRPRRTVPPLRRTRRDIRPHRHPHNQQHPLTCNTTRVRTFDEQHWGFSISGINGHHRPPGDHLGGPGRATDPLRTDAAGALLPAVQHISLASTYTFFSMVLVGAWLLTLRI